MAYNNIDWINNDTPLNADNMNNIMEGISLALGYTDRFRIPGVGSEGITKPTMFRLGIANYSIIGNDLEHNQGYGEYSTALGTNTVAGSNAFEITNIADKVITLTSVTGIKEVLNAESKIQYSCQLTENYDLCGNITDVDETNKTITVDIIPNSTTTTGILWIPSHPELGDGKTLIGTGALAIGNNNKASQIGSFVAGKDNIAGGKYSGVFGDGNKAGYASLIGGQYNIGHQWSLIGGYSNKIYSKYAFASGYGNTVNGESASALGTGNIVNGEASFITGQSSTINSINSLSSGVNNLIDINAKESIAAGSGNKIYAPHSVALGFKNIINASSNGRSTALGSENIIGHNYCATFGKQLQTGTNNQIIVGRQNVVDENAVFIVANGTADTGTSNALVVKKDGSAEVKTMGNTDNSVATKKYVDDKQEIGEWTPQIKSTIDWITIDSYNATYVKNGAQIELQFSVTLSWEEAGTSNVSLKFIGLPIVAGESSNYFLNANATFKDNITGLSYSNFNILGSGLNEFAFLCKEYQDYSQYTTQTVGTTVLKDYFGSSGNIQISGSATYTLFDF